MKVEEIGGNLDVGFARELPLLGQMLEMGVKVMVSCLGMGLPGQTRGWNGMGNTWHFQGKRRQG